MKWIMEGKLTDMVPRMHPRFIVLTWRSYGMCEWIRIILAATLQLRKHFEVFTFSLWTQQCELKIYTIMLMIYHKSLTESYLCPWWRVLNTKVMRNCVSCFKVEQIVTENREAFRVHFSPTKCYVYIHFLEKRLDYHTKRY